MSAAKPFIAFVFLAFISPISHVYAGGVCACARARARADAQQLNLSVGSSSTCTSAAHMGAYEACNSADATSPARHDVVSYEFDFNEVIIDAEDATRRRAPSPRPPMRASCTSTSNVDGTGAIAATSNILSYWHCSFCRCDHNWHQS